MSNSNIAYWGSTEQGQKFFNQLPRLIKAINQNTEAVRALAETCKASSCNKAQEKPKENK